VGDKISRKDGLFFYFHSYLSAKGLLRSPKIRGTSEDLIVGPVGSFPLDQGAGLSIIAFAIAH
jgi:hypothetical protein